MYTQSRSTCVVFIDFAEHHIASNRVDFGADHFEIEIARISHKRVRKKL